MHPRSSGAPPAQPEGEPAACILSRLTRTKLGFLDASTGRGFNSRPTPPTVQALGAEAKVPARHSLLVRPLAGLQAHVLGEASPVQPCAETPQGPPG